MRCLAPCLSLFIVLVPTCVADDAAPIGRAEEFRQLSDGVIPGGQGYTIFIPLDEPKCLRLIRVRLTKQPYKLVCRSAQPGEETEFFFDMLRVQSVASSESFVFSVIWPKPTIRSRSPVVSIISNAAGESYMSWTWGRKWLYIARLGTGNREEDVLRRFMGSVSETPGEKLEGVVQATDRGTTQSSGSGPAQGRDHLHDQPVFGLSHLAAAIDLKEVVGPDFLTRYCTMPTGALGLRVKAIRSLADECLAIRIHDLSDRRVLEIHGQGTQWNLVEHFLIESQTLSSKSSHGPKDGDFPDF